MLTETIDHLKHCPLQCKHKLDFQIFCQNVHCEQIHNDFDRIFHREL